MIKANGTNDVSMNLRMKITGSYFVSTSLAYGIMLVIMSFNEGAFVTVVAGLTAGNFIFGYMKKQIQIKDRKDAKQRAQQE